MRDIAEAIKAGEKNRDTIVLVRNWCAHAQVEKFGGTGLIEMETGLPIGHHGLRCDYAPAGGSFSWDLRESVIDFYDRNCASCPHRKPVRLPNITEIVAQRDRARAARVKADAIANQQVADALAIRTAKRAALRPQLNAIGQTLLDDIAAYDDDRSSDNFDRLTQSARLAPEHFGSALTQYVFELAEAEGWFAGAALVMLDAVGADDQRIARLAIRTLAHGHPASLAFDKLKTRIDYLASEDVADVLHCAVHLANPEYVPFLGDGEPARERHPGLLHVLYDRHPNAVLKELEAWLLVGKRVAVEAAGRGIQALQQLDPTAAQPILRTMVSVYVRADTLIADLKDEGDRLPDLADALNDAFEDSPEAVDSLLQEYADGATAEQRTRIYKVYGLAVHVNYRSPPVAADSRRHNLALSRLVWAPTLERSDEAMRELVSAFRPRPDGLAEVLRNQLDAFIGALLLLTTRLAELDGAELPAGETVLQGMERHARRVSLVGLMENYVEWASIGAFGHEPSIAKIAAIFDELPEDEDQLRSMLLGATKKLAEDLDGLRHFLPHLYHALVGSSVRGRGYAASAVGELPYRASENLPNLLYEAFCALLWDTYVYVHKSAVRAFRRARVPESLRPGAARAVLSLVHYYRVQSHEDDFLATCVRLLAGMIDVFGKDKGAMRQYLVEVAMGIDPLYLRSELGSLAHTLGEEPAFGKLIAKMLPAIADGYNRNDEGIRLLQRLSDEAVMANAQPLHEAALLIAEEDLLLALAVIDTFLRAGALDQAISTSAAMQAAIGDTVRTRRRRTLLQWPALAARFEQAIAAGDTEQIGVVAAEWRAAAVAEAEDERDSRERHSRSSLPFQN